MPLRLFLPLTYFISTRAKNWRALLGFVCFEFAPLALTLWFFYKVDPLLMGASFVCFIGLYEIAYLVNDTSPSSGESGGSRLDSAPHPLWAFALFRILWAVAAAAWIVRKAGLLPALIFLGSSTLILLLSLLHTRVGLSPRSWPRVMTFTALAIYKYAPWTLPFVPLARGGMLLAASFFFFGLSRTVEYGVRKLPWSTAQTASGRRLQPTLQASSLALFLPIVLLLGAGDLLCLWMAYAVILGLSFGATLLRDQIERP